MKKQHWLQVAIFNIRKRGGVGNCLKMAMRKYREGMPVIWTLIKHAREKIFETPLMAICYDEWRERFETLTEEDTAAIQEQIATMRHAPLISIAMPVYNPRPEFLLQAIESVKNQIYPHWELRMADDASGNAEIINILERASADDSRIKFVERKENGGICLATNSAIDICSGSYIALMDHDDLLSSMALYHVAMEIMLHPDAQFIYTDEDIVSQEGQRLFPVFKPDWNEPLLLAENYICHLSVFRTSLLRNLGGLRRGYEGSQDHDLALRCALSIPSESIRHIPRILYHWRCFNGSGSFSDTRLRDCEDARLRCAKDYLEAKGEKALLARGQFGINDVRLKVENLPPLSCIITPLENAGNVLNFIEKLSHDTDYPDLEIIIATDGQKSREEELSSYANGHQNIKIIHCDNRQNRSEIINMAVSLATGEVLGLLNANIGFDDKDWLKHLVAWAMRQGTGAVGPKLVSPDGRLQHAGLVRGLTGIAGYPGRGLSENDASMNCFFQLPHWVTGLDDACLVTRRSLFLEMDGLDAENFPNEFPLIDYCLGLHERGLRNVYVGNVKLFLEAPVDNRDGIQGDQKKITAYNNNNDEYGAFMKKWPAILGWDPYYSPHFSREMTIPSLLERNESPYLSPDRQWKPWEKHHAATGA